MGYGINGRLSKVPWSLGPYPTGHRVSYFRQGDQLGPPDIVRLCTEGFVGVIWILYESPDVPRTVFGSCIMDVHRDTLLGTITLPGLVCWDPWISYKLSNFHVTFSPPSRDSILDSNESMTWSNTSVGKSRKLVSHQNGGEELVTLPPRLTSHVGKSNDENLNRPHSTREHLIYLVAVSETYRDNFTIFESTCWILQYDFEVMSPIFK